MNKKYLFYVANIVYSYAPFMLKYSVNHKDPSNKSDSQSLNVDEYHGRKQKNQRTF